jgi:hypothetical protein
MADNSNPDAPKDSIPEGISLAIIDTWKLKLPSVYIALPPEFLNHVGGIVIAWGMFEKSFEDFLSAMIAESGNVYKGWQFFSFEQKRGIFDETKLCFSQCPVILASLSALMEDTKPQQIKRNVLVHGTIVLKIEAAIPSLMATGRHKGQEVTETFTKDSIDDLYYEIIHAAGRMHQFVNPDLNPFVPPLPSPEISILQAVLSKSPNARSRASMISRPAPPSGA